MQILNQLMNDGEKKNELPSETNSNSLNENEIELSNTIKKREKLKKIILIKLKLIMKYLLNQ